MDTPQAAASLFGPEDPSSDPFAVIGEGVARNTESAFPQENTSFLDSAGQRDPFDYRHSYPEYETAASYNEASTWNSTATDVVHSTQQYSGYEPTSMTTHYEPDGLYDDSYGATSVSAQHIESPYNPSHYLPPASQEANHWAGASTSVTDRYAPPPASVGAPSYDPYSQYSQPSTSSQYSAYATPAYPVPPPATIPVKPTIPAPAPPPVTKPIERPKVSNAYDPPFPTTKSRRAGRSTSQTQQAYGTYGTYQAPVAPPVVPPPRATPPPPKASVYPTHHKPPPNAHSRTDYSTYSSPVQPPARREASSPYAARSPPAQSPGYSNGPLVRSPPTTNKDAPQWATAEYELAPSAGVVLNQFDEHAPALNHSYNGLPVASASSAHYGLPPPSNVPATATDAQVDDVKKPLSPLMNFHPVSDEHDLHQPPSFSSPELSRDHQTPDGELVDPYAPTWASTHRSESPAPLSDDQPAVPPLQQAYPSPEQQYLPPRQVYSPPEQVYSPPSQIYSPPQKLYSPPTLKGKPPTNPPALDQPVYGGPYAPSGPAASVSHAYELSSSLTLDESQFNQATSLHANSMTYAPSPSLLGSNDPLARTTARVPVISFGFGGRLVTCFHGTPVSNTGFGVTLSNRNAGSVNIHILQKFLPKSALEHSEVVYPGPLFPDSTGTSLALVRAAASAQSKSKKPRVVKYLQERADEITQGLAYQSPQERGPAEAKLVLINLLKVLVENDGQLLGSPLSEGIVRAILVPDIATRTSDSHTSAEFTSPALYSTGSTVDSTEAPISVTTLTSSSLVKIEELLMRGERRQAYTFALDQKLWAHAMVIASSIDKEAWKEVVNDFIHTELATKEGSRPTFRRESLRAAYSLFSGQGAAAVKELVPTKLISLASGLQPPDMMIPSTTPRTPAFPQTTFATSSPPASLSQWRETAAMMIASPLSQDASSALTALGDQLMSYGWVEAAHVCYLLSPQTSPVGGPAAPTTRIVLLGCKAPQFSHLFAKDTDVFILSEILEYALSLAPVVKGTEPFNGLAHLQAYRLVRASSLAEVGDIQLANRYCEAISGCLSKGSPYFNTTLVDQLSLLTQRVNGVAHSEKSGSWIGGKISKPSLDTIGGWLDRRFTKLVTGDGDSETAEEEDKKAALRTFDGPFNHYSTISTTPSARSSPQPTAPKHNPYAPPQRTSSAMAMSAYLPVQPTDRASSAMDYHPSVHAQATFAYGNHASHSSPALGLNTTSQPPVNNGNNYPPSSNDPKTSPDGELETPVQGGSSWWDYSASSNGNAQTPTAATFMQVEEPVVSESNNGFISLMDNQQFGFHPKSASAPPARGRPQDIGEDDEEDLGFGNKKPNQQPSPIEGEKPGGEKQPAATPPASKPNDSPQGLGEQQAAGGGWLSRWWKGGSEGSGPVKVKLGEENSFYYDKEQKRWINKKAGTEEPAPAPAPPPPRAATASPSRAAFRPPVSSSAPPPARSSSAMDFSSPSENIGSRVRSNLVPALEHGPPMGGSRPPSTAPGQGPPPPGSRPPSTAPGQTPPGSRPRSQATKKNIRSRYVDVFQQENPGS